jgi:hypothetical protein
VQQGIVGKENLVNINEMKNGVIIVEKWNTGSE